jgi:hypothetical protein
MVLFHISVIANIRSCQIGWKLVLELQNAPDPGAGDHNIRIESPWRIRGLN